MKNRLFLKILKPSQNIMNLLIDHKDNYMIDFHLGRCFLAKTRFVKVSGWFTDRFDNRARKVWIKIGNKRVICNQMPKPAINSISSAKLSKSDHGFEAEVKIGNGIKLIHVFAERFDGKIITLDRFLSFFPNHLPKENIIVKRSEIVPSERYMFAFISGCPGDAYRYRCEHCASALNYLGYRTKVYPVDFYNFSELLETAQIVIAHRVPFITEFERFINAANKKGVTVIFDTDDLVFEPKLAHKIDAFNRMNSKGKKMYLSGLKKYRKSMGLCNGLMVSTVHLRDYASKIFPETPIIVRRNIVSEEMHQLANEALHDKNKKKDKDDANIYIAYFSGTQTHEKDFEQCVEPLRRILIDFPFVKLMLVGHINIPNKLKFLQKQIEHVPFMKWQELPKYFTKVAISLSPLEKNNEFTLSKSELKFLEASLVGVPTVATKLGAFEHAIEHKKDGLLCESDDDWYKNLKSLIKDSEYRKKIGIEAAKKINNFYLPKSSATSEFKEWSNLLKKCSQNNNSLLKINWLLRAPIANTGGGYKLIFLFGNYLGQQGHEVIFYIERIAHLENKSKSEVIEFCHKYFDCSHIQIIVDYNHIQKSDVTIATNWPTAYTLNRLSNTLLKAYFVADFEPEFYQINESNYRGAMDTYDFSFLIITLGRYLSIKLGKRNNLTYPSVDFILNDTFFKNPKLDRHANLSKSPSILFFARPDIPRRNMTLGVEALTELKRLYPKVEITLYGLDKKIQLPFEYKNLGIISQQLLAIEMRKSNFHFSLSETNITTVIFEAMACGCISVELDIESVSTMVKNGENCLLVPKSSTVIANKIVDLINNPTKSIKIARNGYESVKHMNLSNAGSQLEKILKKRLFL